MGSGSWATFAIGISLGIVLGLIGGAVSIVGFGKELWPSLVGPLIGAAGTVAGFAVATYNAQRGVRINLLTREQDRIERELPNLVAARDYLADILERIEKDDRRRAREAILSAMTEVSVGLKTADETT